MNSSNSAKFILRKILMFWLFWMHNDSATKQASIFQMYVGILMTPLLYLWGSLKTLKFGKGCSAELTCKKILLSEGGIEPVWEIVNRTHVVGVYDLCTIDTTYFITWLQEILSLSNAVKSYPTRCVQFYANSTQFTRCFALIAFLSVWILTEISTLIFE